jgi:glycogen(starch) synthase
VAEGGGQETEAVSEETAGPRGLRILAIGNMYPPQHVGGYELMWEAAMVHARASGHRVRVLASDYRHRDGGDRPETHPDVYRTLRWYWDLDRYEFPRLNPLQRLAVERHNGSELTSHLRDFRPDVVSWWSMNCMSLGLIERVRRIGIPAVFVVHDDWIAWGRHHDQWIRMWRGRRRLAAPVVEALFRTPTSVDLNRSGAFVFNSRHTLERAREAGLGVASAVVIYPGIDDRFSCAFALEPWRWRLVYVGRLDRQKGIDTAVRALAHLPQEATLSIWGTGDDAYVSDMRTLAASLGVADRVRFHGWAGPDMMQSIYREADAVVFPVRWEEPFGLVPVEAMGMGRPVVTTARGGTQEFVRDGENALVFDADDDEALAERIIALAEDPELRGRLRDGGLATAASLSVHRFAERTVEQISAAVTVARAHPVSNAS